MTRFVPAILACLAACNASRDLVLETPGETFVASSTDALQGGSIDRGHAAVGLVWIKSERGLALCTGTLIAPDLVLTAAHCATDTVEGFYLGVGAPHTDIGEPTFLDPFVRHAVDAQRKFPDWAGDCASQLFDIALLHLAEPIMDVSPIAMATVPKEGSTCVAVGYGAHTYPDKTASGQKRKGLEAIVLVQEARIATQGKTAHTDTGDSGGPLLCSGQVVGTVSCGNEAKGETTYARVDAAITWIRSAALELRQ